MKSLIPPSVVTALGTIFVFCFFVMYGIPDENEILKMILDVIYNALRPMTSGTTGQIMDISYGLGVIAYFVGIIAGILVFCGAILVVVKWVERRVS